MCVYVCLSLSCLHFLLNFQLVFKLCFSEEYLIIIFPSIFKETSKAAVKDDSGKEILDINVKSAIIFVITASTFLVLLYFFMSSWFVWVLIILFCIGGIEVQSSFDTIVF